MRGTEENNFRKSGTVLPVSRLYYPITSLVLLHILATSVKHISFKSQKGLIKYCLSSFLIYTDLRVQTKSCHPTKHCLHHNKETVWQILQNEGWRELHHGRRSLRGGRIHTHVSLKVHSIVCVFQSM